MLYLNGSSLALCALLVAAAVCGQKEDPTYDLEVLDNHDTPFWQAFIEDVDSFPTLPPTPPPTPSDGINYIAPQ